MARFKFTIAELEAAESNPWLSDRERLVFTLYYRHGWSIEFIADALHPNSRYDPRTVEEAHNNADDAGYGVSRSTVDRTLSNIRKKTLRIF